MARLRVARGPTRVSPRRRPKQVRAAAASVVDGHRSIEMHMDLGRDDDSDIDTLNCNCMSVLFDGEDQVLGQELLEAWPTVKLRLSLLKVCATLNLDEGSMTVSAKSKSKTKASDLAKGIRLVQLLACGVPAFKAIKAALSSSKQQFGTQVLRIGFQKDGLCSKFGITEKQFLRRRTQGLDVAQLRAINEYTGCELFVGAHTVAAIGPSPKILQVVMWAVEGCIVRKELPSHRLRDFFASLRLHRQLTNFAALRI